jgi:hypothetical protein
LATQNQSLALKIFGAVTGTIALGIFAFVQLKPMLSKVDAEHPGPIIAVVVAVVAIAALSVWRLVVRKRQLGSRIRRRGE